ncbi:MAG: hypothetical protein KC713_00025 [Candidatus Omnitrophica bacterium]|nr:hypothetical protein [Candidatus Omnitrophota bacterium]
MKDETQPIISLIQDIKDKRRDPKSLNKELRQQCVEVLLAEGYSKSHIAEILGRSEKTIGRDMDDINLSNSLMPDEMLWKKTVGELRLYMTIHRGHLMRLSRMKSASVSERLQAEYLAFKVMTEYIAKLQSLGYLPTQPQTFIGEMGLTVDNNTQKSLQELESDLIELENVYKENSGEIPEEVHARIKEIRQDITKASIQTQIKQLEHKSEEVDDDHLE